MCLAVSPPLFHRDLAGAYKPVVSAYKNTAGKWQSTTVVEQNCWLDSLSSPIICQPLNSSLIGAPNGVAARDGNDNMSPPVATQVLESGLAIANDRVPTFPGARNPRLTGQEPFGGSPITQVGRVPASLSHSPYGSEAGTPQSLITDGAPSGTFNTGCPLCLFMEPTAGGRAAISGGDFRGGLVPGADMVQFFANPVNSSARAALPGTSYTATSVVIQATLTPTELTRIQPGMNILTNPAIPNATAATNADSTIDFYAGVIKSATSVGGMTRSTSTVGRWRERNPAMPFRAQRPSEPVSGPATRTRWSSSAQA